MSIFKHLITLGWNGFFENQFDPSLGLIPARVIGEEKSNYRIQFRENLTKNAVVSGKFRHETIKSDFPGVGDWVLVDANLDGDQSIIHKVFDRRSLLLRKTAGEVVKEQVIASNIDHILIATSLNQDLNLNRLNRYLTLAWDSGATPVIILTKSDLCENVTEKLQEIESVSIGVDKVVTSCMSEEGIEEIKKYFMPHKTNVLVGSSGVGKSTLVNSLFGETKMKTQEIREDDDKGKHTTTSRHLFLLPSGGMIIDTPGMRELQLWSNDDGLERQFQDIEDLKSQCKFSNCSHVSEPGCQILAALDNGTLLDHRWESYLKMKREIEYLYSKMDKGLQSERKKKWKKISKDAQAHMKLKKSGKNF